MRHVHPDQIAAKLKEFLAVPGRDLPEDSDEWQSGLLLLAADLCSTVDEAVLAELLHLSPSWVAVRAARLRAHGVWKPTGSATTCYWQLDGWAGLLMDILVAEGTARRVYGAAGEVRWAMATASAA